MEKVSDKLGMKQINLTSKELPISKTQQEIALREQAKHLMLSSRLSAPVASIDHLKTTRLFFEKMNDMYGAKWTAQYGVSIFESGSGEPSEAAKKWTNLLARLTEIEVQRALKCLMEEKDRAHRRNIETGESLEAWPPTYADFVIKAREFKPTRFESARPPTYEETERRSFLEHNPGGRTIDIGRGNASECKQIIKKTNAVDAQMRNIFAYDFMRKHFRFPTQAEIDEKFTE